MRRAVVRPLRDGLHGPATAEDLAPSLLPAGDPTTGGGQIVGARSWPVRIVAVGWLGGDGDGGSNVLSARRREVSDA
jgi:hypothetical protein